MGDLASAALAALTALAGDGAVQAPPVPVARYCALSAGASGSGEVGLSLSLPSAAQTRALVRGVPVSAGPEVSAEAAEKAAELVERMLDQSPGVEEAMRRARVYLVVIPREKNLTDLPQFAALRGVRLPDGRVWDDVRGVGFVSQADGSAAVAAGEENLLASPADGYPKGYLVAHELSHAVHEYGAGGLRRRQIARAYAARKASGAEFASRYSATTVYEYFAVSAGLFFGVRLGGADAEKPWEWVAAEDGPLAAAIAAVYGARRPVWSASEQSSSPQRAGAKLSGGSPAASPTSIARRYSPTARSHNPIVR